MKPLGQTKRPWLPEIVGQLLVSFVEPVAALVVDGVVVVGGVLVVVGD